MHKDIKCNGVYVLLKFRKLSNIYFTMKLGDPLLLSFSPFFGLLVSTLLIFATNPCVYFTMRKAWFLKLFKLINLSFRLVKCPF